MARRCKGTRWNVHGGVFSSSFLVSPPKLFPFQKLQPEEKEAGFKFHLRLWECTDSPLSDTSTRAKMVEVYETHPAYLQTKLSEESCFRSCFPKQLKESVLTTVFSGLPAIQHQSWEELLESPDIPEVTMLAATLGGGQEGMAPDSAAHLDIGWRPRPLTHASSA